MADKLGSLELEAQKRRDRLKGLRKAQKEEISPTEEESNSRKKEISLTEEESNSRKKEISPTEEESTTQDEATTQPESSLMMAKFRSYAPKLQELQDSVIAKPAPLDVAAMLEDQLQAARPESLPEDVELTNLAPRKPDWDLKRDVAKSLERLERRTQRAVAELIRQRLASTKDIADLVEAVAWGAKSQEEQAVQDEW